MLSRFPTRLRAAIPNALALLASLGIVFGSLGFSHPLPNGDGDFPCQGHGCGCSSAEACWLGCCCLTPAERLAWAKENNVTPPAEFLEFLEISQETKRPEASKPVAACCHAKTKAKSCCKSTATCCAHHSKTTVAEKTDEPENQEPQLCPGRCHGLGQWWLAGGQPLALPLKPVALSRSCWETELCLVDPRYDADRAAPPTRPG